jgi:hypothetical protein
VTGNDRASEGALIARGGNYDHASSGGLIKRFFQRLLPFAGRVGKGKA